MKNVWMVFADTWRRGYGSSIYLVGIFDSEELADKAIMKAKKEGWFCRKEIVEINKSYKLTDPWSDDDYDDDGNLIEKGPDDVSIYLGGYIE